MYKIKAYTRWNLNFKSQKLFEKDIQVQRVITPRLLLKLDWERETYGPGDSAVAMITARNLKNENIARAEVNYKVAIEGQQVVQGKILTTSSGATTIKFLVPANVSSTDGLLQALVSDNGVEESISRSVPIVLNKISLQFFPEGGDMIDGASTRVAFKALNEFGKAADVAGQILKGNQVVATFNSFHMGMGAFNLKVSDEKYVARVTNPAGISETFPLPPVVDEGYTLNLKNRSKNKLVFNIQSSSASIEHTQIVCTLHGQAVWQKGIDLRQGINVVEVNTDSAVFVSGIGVFTLFDQAGRPRCERLTYINKSQQLQIAIQTSNENYQPGGKVDVDITTTDTHGSPIPARLSLAVVDDQLLSFADDKQDNILSWFQLSSEVKGDIQEPSFYFDPSKEKADEALEYLLMTQGWRHFSWTNLDENIPITYVPDKDGTISGYITHTALGYRRAKGTVTLVEMGNLRRVKQIETRDDGSFDFVNADPTVASMIIVKKGYQIYLNEQSSKRMILPRSSLPGKDQPNRAEEFGAQAQNIQQSPVMEVGEPLTNDLSMASDVTSLSEVVVVGYGSAEKRDITGSVVSVAREDILVRGVSTIESGLSGRIAGIQVIANTGSAGSAPNIRLRGYSSMGIGNYLPLYVIDGIPVADPVNANFTASSIISTDNIHDVTVYNTPETTTLFGSRAVDGVISITSSNSPRLTYYPDYNHTRKPRYIYLVVPPQKHTTGREFYVPPVVSKTEDESRRDFRTTVFWKQHIVTDKNGKASISFLNNDNTSVFRITAEGVASNGLIGRKETTYSTQLPFSVDVKIPEFIGFEDTLHLPIKITNITSKATPATIKINVPEQLMVLGSKTIEFEATASATSTIYATIVPTSKAGSFDMSVDVSSKKFHDEIKQTITVHPVGFPVAHTWSSADPEKILDLDIRDAEINTIKGRFEAYTGVLATLMSDAQSMLSEPHGCFEQVSSATFPNIMALQYLKKVGKTHPAFEQKAAEYIRSGYRQLVAYEIGSGGFEWFGQRPAHEALSAYGMMEFYEMQKVYDKVDADIVNRTATWLLSRRDGNGGFKQHSGKYGFAAAPAQVNNAYLVYALAETGHAAIEKEYNTAFKEALNSKDPYRSALMAIASYDLGKTDNYHLLIDQFKTQIEEDGFGILNSEASVVYSGGQALRNETVAFWMLALAKSSTPDIRLLSSCAKYLMANRQYRGFGPTYTTSVCLQAMCSLVDILKGSPGDGTIAISVNSKLAQTVAYKTTDVEAVAMEAFTEKLLTNGAQSVQVKFSNSTALPWQLQVEWFSKTPAGCESCKLGISTTMPGEVKVNETVRLTTTLTNKTGQGLPMSMVVIGIPAGLSVQPWQLKELQEKKVFDFYEVIGDRLAIYYRELGPSAVININLDLKAELPGTFRGAASTTYLYYADDCKQWAEGVAVTVVR
ncbi:MAG TPA: TonB-dependent receptor plug domain-containing protein [Cyclobacteriaceae bacterium]|nr:TonB-dependent receptor plug domain-containing protein [Cyclobacteriaceae bacterium]